MIDLIGWRIWLFSRFETDKSNFDWESWRVYKFKCLKLVFYYMDKVSGT